MTIKNLAVLTHGPDGPGMNAAVRAVVRMALQQGWQVQGVRQGFKGLLAGEFVTLQRRSVSGTIELGGTFLGAAELSLAADPLHLREAQRQLNAANADALVVIGGREAMHNGALLAELGFAVVGVPATIENDIWGVDQAIGLDTALNTALEAIDRIKDTASSQQEAFVVQVAGAQSGHLALQVAIAGGAEVLCVPERPYKPQDVAREVSAAYVRGKQHCIIVVAEGARPDAQELARALEAQKTEIGFETHLTMLSHLQRGGAPLERDRVLGTQLGAEAVTLLAQGKRGIMVGLLNGVLTATALHEAAERVRELDPEYLTMAGVLAR